jgi:sulfide:quinone oxidoreductase
VLKDKPGETKTIGFDMLHIGPPQRAAAVVRESPIAHQDGQMVGFTKVDIHALQSPDYPNVFGLGDAAGLLGSRTGAAVRKQVPVLINNMLKVMQGKEPDKTLQRLHLLPAGDRLRAHGAGRVRLRRPTHA